jgi:hypothetical protein
MSLESTMHPLRRSPWKHGATDTLDRDNVVEAIVINAGPLPIAQPTDEQLTRDYLKYDYFAKGCADKQNTFQLVSGDNW